MERMARLIGSLALTFAVVFIISPFLSGCGEQEERPPYPGDVINGTWTGSLISDSTGRERTFEAMLCYREDYKEDTELLPPYYIPLYYRTPKEIAPEVIGVFKIRSDDKVDTLMVIGFIPFHEEWKLFLRLIVQHRKHKPEKIEFEMEGIVSDDTVEGSYAEYGEKYRVDTGIWRGIRAKKPTTQHKEEP